MFHPHGSDGASPPHGQYDQGNQSSLWSNVSYPERQESTAWETVDPTMAGYYGAQHAGVLQDMSYHDSTSSSSHFSADSAKKNKAQHRDLSHANAKDNSKLDIQIPPDLTPVQQLIALSQKTRGWDVRQLTELKYTTNMKIHPDVFNVLFDRTPEFAQLPVPQGKDMTKEQEMELITAVIELRLKQEREHPNDSTDQRRNFAIQLFSYLRRKNVSKSTTGKIHIKWFYRQNKSGGEKLSAPLYLADPSDIYPSTPFSYLTPYGLAGVTDSHVPQPDPSIDMENLQIAPSYYGQGVDHAGGHYAQPMWSPDSTYDATHTLFNQPHATVLNLPYQGGQGSYYTTPSEEHGASTFGIPDTDQFRLDTSRDLNQYVRPPRSP